MPRYSLSLSLSLLARASSTHAQRVVASRARNEKNDDLLTVNCWVVSIDLFTWACNLLFSCASARHRSIIATLANGSIAPPCLARSLARRVIRKRRKRERKKPFSFFFFFFLICVSIYAPMHGLTWWGAASAPSISSQLASMMSHPLRMSFLAWCKVLIACFL